MNRGNGQAEKFPKRKCIGVMHTVDISGKQLYEIMISEARTHGIAGYTAGVLVRANLQQFLIPTLQVILIL
jgi:hypothetical protein